MFLQTYLKRIQYAGDILFSLWNETSLDSSGRKSQKCYNSYNPGMHFQ
jgi:hypothetical protein